MELSTVFGIFLLIRLFRNLFEGIKMGKGRTEIQAITIFAFFQLVTGLILAIPAVIFIIVGKLWVEENIKYFVLNQTDIFVVLMLGLAIIASSVALEVTKWKYQIKEK